MALSERVKNEVITKYKQHEGDTGSPEVQVALLSKRIEDLTAHFQTHVKDHASRRGLIQLVSQRRRLLDFLKSRDVSRYNKLIANLGLRK